MSRSLERGILVNNDSTSQVVRRILDVGVEWSWELMVDIGLSSKFADKVKEECVTDVTLASSLCVYLRRIRESLNEGEQESEMIGRDFG